MKVFVFQTETESPEYGDSSGEADNEDDSSSDDDMSPLQVNLIHIGSMEEYLNDISIGRSYLLPYYSW